MKTLIDNSQDGRVSRLCTLKFIYEKHSPLLTIRETRIKLYRNQLRCGTVHWLKIDDMQL